jgi:hypothetical protein
MRLGRRPPTRRRAAHATRATASPRPALPTPGASERAARAPPEGGASSTAAATPAGVAPAPARAEVDRALVRATRAFDAADFDGALAAAEHAQRLLRADTTDPADRRRLARASLLAGMANVALGRGDEARRSLRAALAFDETIRPDPERASPTIAAAFRDAQEQIRADASGSADRGRRSRAASSARPSHTGPRLVESRHALPRPTRPDLAHRPLRPAPRPPQARDAAHRGARHRGARRRPAGAAVPALRGPARHLRRARPGRQPGGPLGPGPGPRARRPGGAADAEPAGVRRDLGGARQARRHGGADQHQPDGPRPPARHRRGRRQARDRGLRVPDQLRHARGRRPVAGARRHGAGRGGGPAGRRPGPRRRAGRAVRRSAARRRAGRAARRRRPLLHLHVRHHRPAQGRAPLAPALLHDGHGAAHRRLRPRTT